MPNITTCPVCGRLYGEVSEEEANRPGRICPECWKKKTLPGGEVMERTEDNANERFERLAEEFYQDMHMLAFGKDQGAGANGTPTEEERYLAWTAWIKGRNRADARMKAMEKVVEAAKALLSSNVGAWSHIAGNNKVDALRAALEGR